MLVSDALGVRQEMPQVRSVHNWRSCTLVAIVFLIGCTTANQPPVIRMATFSPSQSWTVSKVLEPWINDLNLSFDGDPTIELFAGGSLGRHPHSQLRMVEEGIADLAYVIPSYTPGVFPDNDLFEVPQLLTGAYSASIASWRMLQRGQLRGYSPYVVLALYTTNPYYLHLASPVDSVAQLRGKKIRVTGSMQAQTILALGAIPIGGLAASELADSIDRGLIDGTLLSWDLMHLYGITSVTSYHLDYPLGFTNLMIAMNRNTFEAMSVEAREVLTAESGEKLIRRLVIANGELANVGYQAALQSGGHVFAQPSEADERDLQVRLRALLDSLKKAEPRTEQQLTVLREILSDPQLGDDHDVLRSDKSDDD